jgi:hypothetical protein
MHYGRATRRSRRSRPGFAFAAALLLGACFDSDQTFKIAETTSTGGGSTTLVDPTTTSSETTATSMSETGPFDTCHDAIQCVNNCALTIQAMIAQDPDYEPDLGCFLECAETLSVDEVYKLFELLSCASEQCKANMQCADGPMDTSGSGSDSGSSSTTTTDGGGEEDVGGGVLSPCIQCIFLYVSDPDPPGCEELAHQCQ